MARRLCTRCASARSGGPPRPGASWCAGRCRSEAAHCTTARSVSRMFQVLLVPFPAETIVGLGEKRAQGDAHQCGAGDPISSRPKDIGPPLRTGAGVGRGARGAGASAVREAARRVASVPNAVAVVVSLVSVDDGWAVIDCVENSVVVLVRVAGVPEAIDVGIQLGGVHRPDAVVESV